MSYFLTDRKSKISTHPHQRAHQVTMLISNITHCGLKDDQQSLLQADELASSNTDIVSPLVYDDAMAMITSASSVYIFAELREMARSSKTNISFGTFEPPLSLKQMIILIEENKKELKKYMTPIQYNYVDSMSRGLALSISANTNNQVRDMRSAMIRRCDEVGLVEFGDIKGEYCAGFHLVSTPTCFICTYITRVNCHIRL